MRSAILVSFVVCLAAYAEPPGLEELVAQLSSDDVALRDEASAKLVKLGEAAEAPLRARLGSVEPEARVRIERVLVDLDAKRCERTELVLLRSICVPSGTDTSLAWGPDGKTIATGSREGQIVIWDASRREPLDGIIASGGPITALAFAPDGKSVFCASNRGHESFPLPLKGPGRGLGAPDHPLAWSPDGRFVACRGEASSVLLYDLERHQVVRRLKETTAVQVDANEAAFSPKGNEIALNYSGHGIAVFDTETGRQVSFSSMKGDRQATRIAWWPDGSLAIAAADGRVRWTDTEIDFRDRPEALAVSADGKRIAVVGKGAAVRIYDGKGAALEEVDFSMSPIRGIAFSPDGGSLAAVCGDGLLRVWSSGAVARFENLTVVARGGMAFTPEGRHLVICAGQTAVVDLQTGDRRHVTAIKRLAPGRAGSEMLVKHGDKGMLSAWDAATETEIPDLPLPSSSRQEARNFWASPDGRWVLESSDGPGILLIGISGAARNLDTGNLGVLDVAWKPDGGAAFLFESPEDGTRTSRVVRLDPIAASRHEFLVTELALATAIDPKGEMLAWSDDGGRIHFVKADTGDEVGSVQEELSVSGVNHLWFADEKLLAFVDDQGVSLWHVPSLRRVARLGQGYVGATAHSKDGRLVALETDRSVQVYEIRKP